eukprot:scaffold100399_cov35-Tisochrysis_lutea.AAC.1
MAACAELRSHRRVKLGRIIFWCCIRGCTAAARQHVAAYLWDITLPLSSDKRQLISSACSQHLLNKK